jgi:hypothetical protein
MLHLAYASYPSGLTAVDLFSRPVPGHQRFDACHFMIRDAGENAPESSFWVDTVHAAGLNQRIGDGGSLPADL